MRTRSRNLAILFLAVLCAMLGGGLTAPLMPFFLAAFGGAGRAYGWLLTTFSIAGFLAAPAWGRLSDGRGRRPVLLLGLAGAGTPAALLAVMAFFVTGNGILRPALVSLVSKRSVRYGLAMGVVSTSMGLGGIMGPLWAGYAFDLDPRYPFLAAAAVRLVAAGVAASAMLARTRAHTALPKAGETRRPV